MGSVSEVSCDRSVFLSKDFDFAVTDLQTSLTAARTVAREMLRNWPDGILQSDVCVSGMSNPE